MTGYEIAQITCAGLAILSGSIWAGSMIWDIIQMILRSEDCDEYLND